MDSVIEQQRKFHEEIDRLENAIALRLQNSGKTQKENIFAEHQAKQLLDRLQKRSEMLNELYEDKDGSRQHELDAMTGPNAMSTFYQRLASVKDYHRRFPNEVIEAFDFEIDSLTESKQKANDSNNNSSSEKTSNEFNDFNINNFNETLNEKGKVLNSNEATAASSSSSSSTASSTAPVKTISDFVKFSDEENFGKYLDLHRSYTEFINLKGVGKVDYVKYLEICDQLFDTTLLPKSTKLTMQYKNYLINLKNYLQDFHKRIRPLYDIEGDIEGQLKTFEDEWRRGIFIGWSTREVEDANGAATEKNEGVYCEACEKWFTKQTLYNAHLPGKKHLAAVKKQASSSSVANATTLTNNSTPAASAAAAAAAANNHTQSNNNPTKLVSEKDIAATEAAIYRLTELLGEQRESTKMNVERKQALTAEELLDENRDDDDEIEDDAEDEEEKPIYNPKNLPLGWDGKPIPYWLYKLHGLNLEFKCEICNNAVYRGPKMFQRHFQEWRHSHGMRSLGIPNTLTFQNVTKIADAESLWKKIQAQKKRENFQPDQEEEYEDSSGNVVKKKVYEDLRREGLL